MECKPRVPLARRTYKQPPGEEAAAAWRREKDFVLLEEKEGGRGNSPGQQRIALIMSSFVDLLVFPQNLEYEFSEDEKVCIVVLCVSMCVCMWLLSDSVV